MQVTRDYASQIEGPPTTTKLLNGVSQSYPGIIMCNLDIDVPLDIFEAHYITNDDFENSRDITGLVTPFLCADEDPSVASCYGIDASLPAFKASTDGSCDAASTILILLSVNALRYSNYSYQEGVSVYLHKPGFRDSVLTKLCERQSANGSCGTLADDTAICNSEISDLAYEELTSSTGFVNKVKLQTTTRQFSQSCDQTITSWNPTQFLTKFGTNFFRLLENATGTRSDDVGYVGLEFSVSSPSITEVTYNPMSGLAFFGGLAGWFGALTDGWGVISILFLAERTFLYFLDRVRRR